MRALLCQELVSTKVLVFLSHYLTLPLRKSNYINADVGRVGWGRPFGRFLFLCS